MARVHRLGGALAGTTSRRGGVSAPPFDSLNVGFQTGDDPAATARNRALVMDAFPGPRRWARVDQVHGPDVLVVDALGAADLEGIVLVGVGDAMVTDRRDVSLAIFTADCAPVALAAGDVVAVAHAGWRGVVAGVLRSVVATIRASEPRARIEALIGPCIRSCCYEFGADDLAQFQHRYGDVVVGRAATGATSLDLPRAVSLELASLDVVDVIDTGRCTACSTDLFSYRRDGSTGRHATLVARA